MVAKNLAEIIPAIFTGPNGERLTPDQIARRQEIAQSLLAQATDTSPNAGGWVSVLGKGALGFASGWKERQADRAAQANAKASAADTQALLGLMGGVAPAPSSVSSGVLSPSPMSATPSAPQQMVAGQPPVPGLQAAYNSILPQSFLAAVDRTEGAGGYDTLFGHAQNGAFKGTSISSMPIRDVLAFTDPSGPYAQSVRSQIGRVATPVGRYQVVGTTLRNAVGALGLDPNQPFDAATQDRVAAYLATNRIRGAGSLPEQISALRNEWEGFRNVPDDQMAQIIADLQNVDPMAVQAQASAPAQSGYVDPMVSVQPRVEVAQALSPAATTMTDAAQAINPAVARVLSDPYADPRNVQLAQTLLTQQQAEAKAARERALEEQERAAEIQRRQQIAQQNGIDPRYAADDSLWKGATSNVFAAPSTSTIGNRVIDNRTGKTVYEAPQETYRQVYGAEAAAMGLDPSKAYNVAPNGEVRPIGEGGVVVNNNMSEDKFGGEFAKLDANTLSTVATSGLAAQRNLGRIDQLETLLKNSPSGFAGAAAQAAGEWGIPVDGLDSLQAAQAAINSLVPEQRQPGSGPMSDADLALFKQSLPRIINQPGGNQTIINTMRGIAQYDAEGAAIVQQLRNGDITRAQAFEMLQNRRNPLADFKAPGETENPLPPQTTNKKASTGVTWEILD